MPRPKKTLKLKEPVRLRSKKLSNGSQSLYLDIYKDGQRQYEFLKLYILPELTPAIKEQNAATLAAANAIKSKRIIEITNNEAGLKNTSQRSKMLLLDWFDVFIGDLKNRGARERHEELCRRPAGGESVLRTQQEHEDKDAQCR